MNAAEIYQSHDALRRTALVLHALAPSDRDWVLQHLPERHREQVRPCLAELAALGIPRDVNLVDEIVIPAEPRQPAEQSASSLAAALRGEPAAFIAIALHGSSTGEQAAVLNGLPPGPAAATRKLLDARAGVPPELRTAIEEEIAAGVKRNANLRTSAEPRSALMRRWQAGWLRISGVFS